jgi:hypothetical protein
VGATDYVELALPCGCTLGLLIQLDARACRTAPASCTEAEDIARAILREWHREAVPSDRPA